MENKVLAQIIQTYETPFYIFDMSVLKRRIAYLRKHLDSHMAICYAVKANTFIIKDIADRIDRFEVCSPGELNICQALDIPMEKVVVSGVYKTPDVMDNLIAKKDTVGWYTVESLTQFNLLSESAKAHHKKIRVLLRLTSGNQFGMDEKDIEEIIADAAHHPHVDIRGIQYFSGTQKQSLKKLKREIDHLNEFLTALEEKLGYHAEELEFGTGFPVAYFASDEFDEAAFLNDFNELMQSMTFKAKITLELGRSIAASCGNYVTRVVDSKINKKQRYALVDGGIHHLVYYGQSMAMKHPKYHLYPERTEDNVQAWNICGSLCTVNDILVKQLPIADLKIGDYLIFENTGAYCMTEGISLFLSRELPRIIALYEDGTCCSMRENIRTDLLNTPKERRN